METGALFAIILGIMQDAGLPHIGCRCGQCASGRVERAACLGLVDARRAPAGVWLFDATPDIAAQLARLAPWLGPHPARPHRLRQPDGLFLTHGHMGHTAGLPQLGPEGMLVQELPVHGPPRLLDQLTAMPLWSPLVAGLDRQPLPAEGVLRLAPDLTVTPVPVPHRDEVDAGTYGYLITGPSRSLLYVPDIDAWKAWENAHRWLAQADVALVDASFYSHKELGGRPPAAHPTVPETLTFFAKYRGQLVLTHLNHTNPLLSPESPESAVIAAAGASVAREGMVIRLGL